MKVWVTSNKIYEGDHEITGVFSSKEEAEIQTEIHGWENVLVEINGFQNIPTEINLDETFVPKEETFEVIMNGNGSINVYERYASKNTLNRITQDNSESIPDITAARTVHVKAKGRIQAKEIAINLFNDEKYDLGEHK